MSICFVTRSSLGEEYLASERLRCDWLMPYLDGVKWWGEDLSQYGAVVYSKANPRTAPLPDDPMCRIPRILDMCDPVWRSDPTAVAVAMSHVDAFTVPTDAMRAEFFAYMGDFPCHVVRDGHDLGWYPRPPKTGPHYVWFGYSRNYTAQADFMMRGVRKNACIVSDTVVDGIKSHLWGDDRKAFKRISRCKVAVIPFAGTDRTKSNNRAISAWAMDLAVARTPADMDRFQDPVERAEDIADHEDEVMAHNASHAAADMMEAINGVRGQTRSVGGPIPSAPHLNYEQSRIPSP